MNSSKPYMPPGCMLAGIVMFGTIAAGCERTGNAPKPVTTAEKSQAAGQPLALSPSSLPPSDAALKPAAPEAAGPSGQAGNQTQATPKTLNREQQSASMPMPGQTNNYSTTESNDRQSSSGSAPK